MKKYGLVFSFFVLFAFFILFSNSSNNKNKNKYLNCIKFSIKNCKHDTKKRKNDIIKNCKIVIRHNQEISQVEHFYTCKQRKN